MLSVRLSSNEAERREVMEGSRRTFLATTAAPVTPEEELSRNIAEREVLGDRVE